MRNMISCMLASLLLIGLSSAVALCDDVKPSSMPDPKTVEGVLIAKTATSIDVRADGSKEAFRYYPFWHGYGPDTGGGYDKDTLAAMDKLAVADHVKVTWLFQEHRRIVSVETEEPAAKEGETTGVVVAKDKLWIDVKADNTVVHYKLRWIGKGPDEGGGYERAMYDAIAKTQVGDKVQVKWIFDGHMRVEGLTPVETEPTAAVVPPASTLTPNTDAETTPAK